MSDATKEASRLAAADSSGSGTNGRTGGRIRIKLRRIAYLAIRVLLNAASACRSRRAGENVRILLYPPFDSRRAVEDIVNRLGCALKGSATTRARVTIAFCAPTGGATLRPEHLPPAQAAYLDELAGDRTCLRNILPERFDDEAASASFILLWRASGLADPIVVKRLAKVLIVDPDYYLAHEPYNYARLPHMLLDDAGKLRQREESRAKFAEIHRRHRGAKTAYVLVTGPSLTSAVTTPLETDAVKIICNSLVKDRELLNLVQPDILVFADPVFHFGPSKYAEEFRRNARAALERFPECWCVVPEMFVPFLAGHMPEAAPRIIGMPQSRGTVNFPTPEEFHAKVTDNIMTFLMLPLAVALSREVVVIGADGRQKTETYYWQHNPKVQFGDLMDSAFATHPSFIRDRVLADYYDEHCATVAWIVDKAEREAGCRVVTRTRSFIPALAARPE